MKTGNYDVLQEGNSAPIKMWTQGVPVEEAAKKQLLNAANLPFIFSLNFSPVGTSEFIFYQLIGASADVYFIDFSTRFHS